MLSEDKTAKNLPFPLRLPGNNRDRPNPLNAGRLGCRADTNWVSPVSTLRTKTSQARFRSSGTRLSSGDSKAMREPLEVTAIGVPSKPSSGLPAGLVLRRLIVRLLRDKPYSWKDRLVMPETRLVASAMKRRRDASELT